MKNVQSPTKRRKVVEKPEKVPSSKDEKKFNAARNSAYLIQLQKDLRENYLMKEAAKKKVVQKKVEK